MEDILESNNNRNNNSNNNNSSNNSSNNNSNNNLAMALIFPNGHERTQSLAPTFWGEIVGQCDQIWQNIAKPLPIVWFFIFNLVTLWT